MDSDLQVVVVGGTEADERPEGWADVFGEWICDEFDIPDHRNDPLDWAEVGNLNKGD